MVQQRTLIVFQDLVMLNEQEANTFKASDAKAALTKQFFFATPNISMQKNCCSGPKGDQVCIVSSSHAGQKPVSPQYILLLMKQLLAIYAVRFHCRSR